MKRFAFFSIPFIIFMLVVVFLYQGLFSNPRALSSQAVNKPMPDFSLPDLMLPGKVYTQEVFKGQVTIVNVWGVWCVTCAVELPYLTALKEQQGVKFVGLYFDQDIDPDFGLKTLDEVQVEVTRMLAKFGDPYAFNIFDLYRDTSLDLGVTGAPEHFVVDKNGVIRMHHIGDINERVWQSKVGPLYEQLRNEE